jgi:predicted TIM-barrel fold metal-dependent hydrolase
VDPEFGRLVEALPNLTIVLEHLASVGEPDGEPAPYALRRKAFDLARLPNVCVKLHGLGEITPRPYPFVEPFPFEGQVPPLLELAHEAFGPGRMMWGSDYPPVSAREGYGNALRFTQERLATRSTAEQELIFGGSARRVFRLEG